MIDPHKAHRAGHALKTATEHDGAKGALAGAFGIALTATVLLGAVGLALTPIGWVILLVVGGIAGALGLFKKLAGNA